MLAALHGLLFASIVYGAVSTSTPPTTPLDKNTNEYAKERMLEEFGTSTVMARIAFCESTDRQFYDDGEVLKGEKDSDDRGLFQINQVYHLKESESLIMDTATVDGNIEYAKFLYQTQGTAPWKASSKCWKD